LLQSGFSAGKSAETVALSRGGKKISAYSSFGEAFFFRGVGATLTINKKWEFTTFYSNRLRDANTLFLVDSVDLESPDIGFTSLQSSGLHRTNREVEQERQIRNQVAGLSVTRRVKKGHLSLNLLHTRYNKPFSPNLAPYRIFSFTGKKLTGASTDYSYFYKNFILTGETAMSDNGKVATTNSLNFAADRKVMLVVLYRYFDRAYQSLFAGPFAEANGASNEKGLYIGMEIKPKKGWQINAYSDIWRHPWLRFQTDAPSVGHGYLARLMYTRRKKMSAYLLWQTETKQQNSSGDQFDFLQDNRLTRTRLHTEYKVGRTLEFNSRVEFTAHQIDNQPVTNGFSAYQDVTFKQLRFPIAFSARYMIFDTDDSNSRIYSYERDLFSALSVPSFAGRGSRFYINATYRVRKFLILEARYGHTLQQHSIYENGFTGADNDFKVQLRMKF
jgi:hypothetical protein